MKKITIFLLLGLLIVLSLNAQAQDKKVWVSGAARGVHFDDSYNNQSENDTVTARQLQSGHAMVDLGVNVMPNDNMHVIGMVRIRNDFGGFWGSGATFDVRQLTVTGVLANAIKYQLGDIDYKLSQYTFNNNTALVNRYMGVISGVPLDQVRYDLFYGNENTWRQQGAAADFGFEFDKTFIKGLDFNGFVSRTRASNFANLDDRLFSGGSVVLTQSKSLKLGAQYVNLFDYEGTSANQVFMRNPVITGSAEYIKETKKFTLGAALESGRSTLEWQNGENTPELNDYFYDIQVKMGIKKMGLGVALGYRDVGAQFRSAGAQTMQINFARVAQAYQRIGNDQDLRQFNMMDLYRDASLYQTQIREGLMAFDPRYDNATPYGRATPNRRGINLDLNYKDKKERFDVLVSNEMLSDIVGQGTDNLRSFNTFRTELNLYIDKFLNLKNRNIHLGINYMNQNTNRDGQQDFEDVSLATQFINFNLTVNLVGDFDFLAEYRTWASVGNEQLAVRNQYSEVIDFREYSVDYNEQMMGFGLQYRFTDNQKLSIMWQNFNWADQLEVQDDYRMNTFTVFYVMNF